MDKLNVEFLDSISGPGFCYNTGDVVEIDRDTALGWAHRNICKILPSESEKASRDNNDETAERAPLKKKGKK